MKGKPSPQELYNLDLYYLKENLRTLASREQAQTIWLGEHPKYIGDPAKFINSVYDRNPEALFKYMGLLNDNDFCKLWADFEGLVDKAPIKHERKLFRSRKSNAEQLLSLIDSPEWKKLRNNASQLLEVLEPLLIGKSEQT